MGYSFDRYGERFRHWQPGYNCYINMLPWPIKPG